MRGVQAGRVIRGDRNRQSHHLGIFDLGAQSLGDKARTVAGEDIQQADGFQFNEIGQ